MSTPQEIAAKAATDNTFRQAIQADPIGTLLDLPPVLQTDKWVYRGIVIVLGLVAAGGLLLVAIMALWDTTVPTIFTAAISAAIGALAGLLVPTPRQ
jgi:hypothetical protein